MYARRWQDGAVLLLGLWLIVSPFWMPDYSAKDGIGAGDSYFIGSLTVGAAWMVLGRPKRRGEWAYLLFGLSLLIAPFWLNPHFGLIGAWNEIASGALLVCFAACSLAQHPLRNTSMRFYELELPK